MLLRLVAVGCFVCCCHVVATPVNKQSSSCHPWLKLVDINIVVPFNVSPRLCLQIQKHTCTHHLCHSTLPSLCDQDTQVYQYIESFKITVPSTNQWYFYNFKRFCGFWFGKNHWYFNIKMRKNVVNYHIYSNSKKISEIITDLLIYLDFKWIISILRFK